MLILEVIYSMAGWFSVYMVFRRTFGHQGAEWNCRLVTLTHGIAIVLQTAYINFIAGQWLLTHAGTKNTELQSRALTTCLGYFLFDVAWCLRHGTEGHAMVAHHAASVLGILLAVGLGESGCVTCAVIFGSEVTNPLLQARWFLRQAGRYDGPLGDVVDMLFVVLFATVRVGVGTVLFYCQLTSPRVSLAMKAGGVVMYGIAWVFMVVGSNPGVDLPVSILEQDSQPLTPSGWLHPAWQQSPSVYECV